MYVTLKAVWRALCFVLSLPFMALELKTWQEFRDAAREAILTGNLDEAETLTRQASALKALDDMQPAAPAAEKKGAPARLPFAPSENDAPAAADSAQNAAIKTWFVKRFGELPRAAEQIAGELYDGEDYTALTWAKHADFRRYLQRGEYDARLSRTVLLTPEQILDSAAHGLTVGEIKATMVEANDELGGYLAPEDFRTAIVQRLPGMTVVRPLANVVTTSRDRITMPTSTGGTSRYTGAVRVTWVEENPGATEAATNATFGQLGIPVHTVMAHTDLSRNLLEDAAFNLVDYLSRQYAEAMAIDEDEQFLVGNGVGKPQGILTGTAASGAPANGDVTTVNSGHASLLTADGLVKVPYGLAGQYRQAGARWAGNKATLQAISLLKDGDGRYLFRPHADNLAAGQPTLLQGYPVLESEALPDVGANKYPLIFGNFTGYAIVDRIGLAIERYSDSTTAKTNTVVFVARRRLGGQVTEGWRFVVQKVAA
jgi:HK97 family phage major capsid protein